MILGPFHSQFRSQEVLGLLIFHSLETIIHLYNMSSAFSILLVGVGLVAKRMLLSEAEEFQTELWDQFV